MSYRDTIKKLVDEGTVESVLSRGSRAKEEVRALQTILYQLGFEAELNWEKFGADGGYGTSTVNAVSAFVLKNGLDSDGTTVTPDTAKKIIRRFDILDDMRYLSGAVKNGTVEKKIYYGSGDSIGITALQTLLNELGLGEALNWEQYGADGHFGKSTAIAVKLFAQLEDMPVEEGRITREIAVCILDKLSRFFGAGWAKEEPAPAAPASETYSGNLDIREKEERGKIRVYISDGEDEVRFNRFKKGVWYVGKQQAAAVVNSNATSLQQMGLTESALKVMIAVSENEGNLDAINTWDNSFMTFGMFQWTVGAGKDPGELASLLAKIKTAAPDVFEKYYGRYGLDIKLTSNIAGYFLLDGKKMAEPSQKDQFRGLQWAYYFWKSGQDPLVQFIQIQHALSRLNTFYRANAYKPNGFYVSDLITSEFGVGLILDNHVNRPGYIKPCLEEAMKRANLFDPVNWGTEEEKRLVEEYIKVRASYGRSPMTDADKRAAVTKKYLDNGTISAERGSFEYDF